MTLTFMWVSYDAITINTFLSLKHMFLDMIVCSITHFENFDMDIVVKMARLNVFNLNYALKSKHFSSKFKRWRKIVPGAGRVQLMIFEKPVQ